MDISKTGQIPESVESQGDAYTPGYQDHIRQEVVWMTPSEAKRILDDRNVRNRNIDRDNLRKMRDDITEGRWRVTPEGIAFSTSGDLLNGQHRLKAIADTGIPINIRVFYDVPIDAFAAMDSSVKKRSGKDTLDIHTGHSISYGKEIASITRLIESYRKQIRNRGGGSTISGMQLLSHYTERTWIEHAARIAVAVRGRTGLNANGIGAGLVLAAETNPTISLEGWIEGLVFGANLNPGSPILALRQYGARNDIKNRYAGQQGAVAERTLRQSVIAYNAWLSGKSIKALSERSAMTWPMPKALPAGFGSPTAAADSIRDAKTRHESEESDAA